MGEWKLAAQKIGVSENQKKNLRFFLGEQKLAAQQIGRIWKPKKKFKILFEEGMLANAENQKKI